MKLAEYERLSAALRKPCSEFPDWDALAKEYPEVPLDTLVSIYSQENQRRILRHHHLHKSPRAVANYVRRFTAGQGILELSAAVDLPPTSLARLLLEGLLGIGKPAISAAVKDPGSLPAAAAATAASPTADPDFAARADDADLIRRLQGDLELCIAHDHVSSPLVDTLRRVAGQEYEAVLESRLEGAGIPFLSEEQLRASGFAKTPDVKLEVPIAVKGRVVHWIDSKACFADEYTHRMQAEEQFKGYVNRYGPGMVVYWFGYIEELDDHPDVMLVEDFPPPEDIVRLEELA